MTDPIQSNPPSATRTARLPHARVRHSVGRIGMLALTLLAALAVPVAVIAKPGILTSWQGAYPGSLSDDEASCALCHAAGDEGLLNAYGHAILQGGSSSASILAIGAQDSDGSGTTNLAEITANAQPGWKAGATNTLYDTNGNVALTNQLPPSGIGAIDPASDPGDTTPPTTTVPTVAARVGSSLAGSAIPVAVRWTGADTGGSGIGHFELEKTVDGGATWTVVSASLAAPAANLSVTTAGTVQLRVRAVDLAANAGSWVTSRVISPRLVQDTSASITWAKTWTRAASTAFSGGSVRYAKAKGATATIRTSGRSFALVTTKAKDRGSAWIYVNGSLKAKVSLYSSTTKARQVVWQTSWTGTAPTIKVWVAGTSGRPRVDLDAIAILK